MGLLKRIPLVAYDFSKPETVGQSALSAKRRQHRSASLCACLAWSRDCLGGNLRSLRGFQSLVGGNLQLLKGKSAPWLHFVLDVKRWDTAFVKLLCCSTSVISERQNSEETSQGGENALFCRETITLWQQWRAFGLALFSFTPWMT